MFLLIVGLWLAISLFAAATWILVSRGSVDEGTSELGPPQAQHI